MFGDYNWLLQVVVIALVYYHKLDFKKQFGDVSLYGLMRP
jgi:hypothetical protein